MRTTLTIDDDIAVKIKKQKNNGKGQSFKEVVNETLRNGLLFAGDADLKPKKKFALKGRILKSKMLFNFNKPHALVEFVEGEPFLR